MTPEPDAVRTEFDGRMLALRIERWGDMDLEIVERVDSVAVVATTENGDVVLVRQFRAPARSELVELPAGTVDEGEEPLETARRELAEETGLHGGRWRAGPVLWMTPGFCRERIHLFFAEDLEAGDPDPQGGEALEVLRWPRDAIVDRLSEVEDAKTLVGLLLLARERS